jgi:two-component system invasion response regulator UvrY
MSLCAADSSVMRVALVDDHEIVRSSLAYLLASDPLIHVVAQGDCGRDALEIARRHRPDVLLIDLEMPGGSGLEVLNRLRAGFPRIAVLVLSAHAEEQFALTCLRLGARGYLAKSCEPKDIVEAVRTVASGKRYITRRVAELLAANTAGRDAQALPHCQLTPRELQILLRLASGQNVASIAGELFLTPKTVSTHRTRVSQKLGLRTNAELTRYAVRGGLVR